MLHLRLIILSVEGDVPVDSETFLMIDFVNLKIKSAQSFKCDHRDKLYAHIVIRISVHIYISICIYIIFLKN
jgi:hypothetical protein